MKAGDKQRHKSLPAGYHFREAKKKLLQKNLTFQPEKTENNRTLHQLRKRKRGHKVPKLQGHVLKRKKNCSLLSDVKPPMEGEEDLS